MVEYFPTNYVWNLSVNIALGTGGNTGEIDEVCRPLIEPSQRTDDSGAEEFFMAWRDLGDRLYSLAEDDLAAGRKLSAGTKLARAAVYYITGERVTHPTFEPRKEAYKKVWTASPGIFNSAGPTVSALIFRTVVRHWPVC